MEDLIFWTPKYNNFVCKRKFKYLQRIVLYSVEKTTNISLGKFSCRNWEES